MPLWIKCSSPFVAPRHPHLRAPPHVCCHVCHTHARPCLCKGWALNRRFDLTFGTAAVLAQEGGGVCARGFGMHNPALLIPQALPQSLLDRLVVGGMASLCVTH